LYAFETREIAIEAEDCRPVLNSQRSKVRVGRQIAAGARGLEQSPEYLSVPLAGMRDLRPGMPEPTLDGMQGVFHRQRPRKNAAAGAQAQESEPRRPRKCDAAWIIETLLKAPPHADRWIW
jgi:hypothetical protein